MNATKCSALVYIGNRQKRLLAMEEACNLLQSILEVVEAVVWWRSNIVERSTGAAQVGADGSSSSANAAVTIPREQHH